MNDSLAQRSRLEAKNNPVAIIHSGMFVFANKAFLDLFKITSFDDLLAIPVLDLVPAEEQQKLKSYLQKAEQDRSGEFSSQEQIFQMQTADD